MDGVITQERLPEQPKARWSPPLLCVFLLEALTAVRDPWVGMPGPVNALCRRGAIFPICMNDLRINRLQNPSDFPGTGDKNLKEKGSEKEKKCTEIWRPGSNTEH